MFSPNADVPILYLNYTQDLLLRDKDENHNKDISYQMQCFYFVQFLDAILLFTLLLKEKLTWFRGLQHSEYEAIITALISFGITPNIDKADGRKLPKLYDLYTQMKDCYYQMKDGIFLQKHGRERNFHLQFWHSGSTLRELCCRL